ncbi:MAG: nucleoside-diphosphate kinase [Thermoplasmata archaeon]|nr:nucleoside-diphosphate kinase [Thermoplasmata archaeon]
MPEGAVERTLVLVKPDGDKRGLVGEIVGRLERKGLKIVAARLLCVTPELAQRHYAEHQGKPFYPGLVAHIGATNPQTAAPGTVRGDLGLAMTPNLIHASDSPASSERELALYFTGPDLCEYDRTDREFV